MKNKIISFLLIVVCVVGYSNQVNSEEFIFESEYLEIKNNGNTIEAKNGVKITSNNKIEITADESFYNKLTLELLLKGNVILIDTERNIKILSEEATYNKNTEKILSKGNVKVYLENNYFLYTESLEYFKKDKIPNSVNLPLVSLDKLTSKSVERREETWEICFLWRRVEWGCGGASNRVEVTKLGKGEIEFW